MTEFSPREIVSELDRYIVGHPDAKKAVAVALRNRWRRRRVPADLRDEVTPKNILMIGPTGVGKTEISRRLAKLAKAPFLKVEATKFTEVGYVGRDVEQIIRDLVDAAIVMTREDQREKVKARAHSAAEERVIDALAGEGARDQTRDMFRKKLRDGSLDDKEIELEVADTSSPFPMMDIPGQPGAGMGAMNLGDIFGKAFGGRKVRRRMTVSASYELLIAEEADKLLDIEADSARRRQQGIEYAVLGGIERAVAHRLHRPVAPILDRDLHQVANDGLDITADVADFGELGRLDLDEGRMGQACKAPGNLGLAHTGRANHQDVLGRDFAA